MRESGSAASEAGDRDHRHYDVIVVGAGVAGLAFALRLPPGLRVALLTKGVLGESNTRYAQGGLAAALGQDDDPRLHEEDTLVAGAGLCDLGAVRRLVDGAGEAVRWLIAQGTSFDAGPDGNVLLGREAAHSRWRILHAGGDATGAEIERALVAGVRADPGVDIFENAFARDLIVRDGRAAGIVAQLGDDAPLTSLEAPLTVLAAGGAGQLWATSTNPRGATADGVAMALRAGVVVGDLEFVQFHPTVLSLPGEAPFLLSEAIRGEGAYLRNGHGERFMPGVHPLAELAPRDVVARGIQHQFVAADAAVVYLDLRHLDPAAMRARFPTIAQELRRRGLDLATDLLPVAPAAHYAIGGVVAGTSGATSLSGLLAIGEAACTGVNGANRLASNSLLEGLVFGLAAADRIAAGGPPSPGAANPALSVRQGADTVSEARSVGRSLDATDPDAMRRQLQSLMSREVAVVRDECGLRRAEAELSAMATTFQPAMPRSRDAWELENMITVGLATVRAAAHRRESRGAHFRSDCPAPDPALDGQHSLLLGARIEFGPLGRVLPDQSATN